jgi:hypothetical protein
MPRASGASIAKVEQHDASSTAKRVTNVYGKASTPSLLRLKRKMPQADDGGPRTGDANECLEHLVAKFWGRGAGWGAGLA